MFLKLLHTTFGSQLISMDVAMQREALQNRILPNPRLLQLLRASDLYVAPFVTNGDKGQFAFVRQLPRYVMTADVGPFVVAQPGGGGVHLMQTLRRMFSRRPWPSSALEVMGCMRRDKLCFLHMTAESQRILVQAANRLALYGEVPVAATVGAQSSADCSNASPATVMAPSSRRRRRARAAARAAAAARRRRRCPRRAPRRGPAGTTA